MANPDHFALFVHGATVWNRWRKENPDVRPDLSNASFTEKDWLKLDLNGMDLTNADLRYADLSHLMLTGLNCSGADATNAKIR
jgi:uncharacterized protein YjbI with pentapeptide repeats